METIEEYLNELEDIFELARSNMFSDKISVNRKKVLEIISQMRAGLPNEIRQAKRIISDGERILADYESRAKRELEDTKKIKEKLTSENEIYKQASIEAEKLINNAKKSAQEMKTNATDYAVEVLSKLEVILKETALRFSKESHTVEDNLAKLLEILARNKKELKNE